jgi:hypothetical protein
MEIRESSSMRELSNEELGLVGGGLAPVGLGLNLGVVGDLVGGLVAGLGGLVGGLVGGLTSLVGGLVGSLAGLTGGLGGL